MALETGTFISDLVSTNPVASDNVSQGDDHIRLLKATIKATFPNIAGAVTPTHTELSRLGTTGSPTFGALTLESTSDTASAGPVLDLFRNSASPAANDILGRLTFSGEDAVGTQNDYARIEGILIDPTNGSEDGAIRFSTLGAGAMTEAMRITEDNKLLMGTTTYLDGWNNTQNMVLAGTSNPGLNVFQASNNTNPGVVTFTKSRGSTPGALTSVVSGDTIGALNFAGADGFNARVTAARITAEVDGTPGLNDMPGRLTFQTTADGASTPTERMRITNAGNVGIGTTTPAGRLDVRGGTIEFDPGVVADEARAFNFNIGGLNYGKILIPTGGSGAMAFHTGSAGAAAERVRILASGSVGIGTSAPASRLDVAGTGNLFRTTDTGSASNFWSWHTNATRRGYIGYGNPVGSELTFLNEANDDVRIGTNAIEVIRIKNSGNVGIGQVAPTCTLDVNGGIRTARATVTAPAATDGNVFSGSYTPTLTNVTNVAASTAFLSQYMRVGNIVTVSGRVAIDPTSASTLTEITMTLPIAATFGAQSRCGGTFARGGTGTGNCGSISADTTNNIALFAITPSSSANFDYWFSFTYTLGV